MILVLAFGHLPGAAESDVAVERFQLDPRAARADGEIKPMLGLPLELHREAGAEVPVERRYRHGDARLFGHGYAQATVVRREAIAPAVLDGPVVDDLPVDRSGVGVRGLDLGHRDVAVHGLRR